MSLQWSNIFMFEVKCQNSYVNYTWNLDIVLEIYSTHTVGDNKSMFVCLFMLWAPSASAKNPWDSWADGPVCNRLDRIQSYKLQHFPNKLSPPFR
jgi:hypothetical protein